MSPRITANDIANIRVISRVLFREIGAAHTCFVKGANFGYLLRGQLGEVRSLAMLATSFGNHIGHIVGVVAQKKVIGSHAARSVAMVEYPPCGHLTVMQQPGDVVCELGYVAHADGSVAGVQHTARPQPAVLSFFYLFPEPLSERLTRINSTWHRSVTPFGVRAPGRSNDAGALTYPFYSVRKVMTMHSQLSLANADG